MSEEPQWQVTDMFRYQVRLDGPDHAHRNVGFSQEQVVGTVRRHEFQVESRLVAEDGCKHGDHPEFYLLRLSASMAPF